MARCLQLAVRPVSWPLEVTVCAGSRARAHTHQYHTRAAVTVGNMGSQHEMESAWKQRTFHPNGESIHLWTASLWIGLFLNQSIILLPSVCSGHSVCSVVHASVSISPSGELADPACCKHIPPVDRTLRAASTLFVAEQKRLEANGVRTPSQSLCRRFWPNYWGNICPPMF